MIVSPSRMKALEERAFKSGHTAESLMDEAGLKIAQAVRQFFPVAGLCVAAIGKGHNGGDALVAAKHLKAHGWDVVIHAPHPREQWSELTRRKQEALGDAPSNRAVQLVGHSVKHTAAMRPLVVLDGLLGTGAGGELRPPIQDAARLINQLRAHENAYTFAIDLPTGVDGETGAPCPEAVMSDFTLAIGYAKTGLVADAATAHVGRLAVLPLSALQEDDSNADETTDTCVDATALAPLMPRRRFNVHKGDFGRIGIIAGSRGLSGAAIMAAEAAVRAGAGLVSLYVTDEIYSVVAAATSPEVMVRPVGSYLDLLGIERDVLAVGPGLGQSRHAEVLQLIQEVATPLIIDADGLNVLATDLHALEATAGPRLLTPHPGEMARLDPDAKTRSRRATVEAFTSRWPHTILFKGARTLVAQRGRPASYNTTGSPGMASGGMGDALTGVCAALAGQGLSLYDAARAGAWLCGRAAELAIFRGHESEESLCASDVVRQLGAAFAELRARCY